MTNEVNSYEEDDRLARLIKRVEYIEVSIDSISSVLNDVVKKLDLLLDQHNRKTENIVHNLSEKQQAVFNAIQLIPGRDESARRMVQEELKKLKGDVASEAFTIALKRVLKDREWGLQSAGGEAAAPLWQADDSSTGGAIRLHRRVKGTNKPTFGQRITVLPEFIIVDRPDGRKRSKATGDV